MDEGGILFAIVLAFGILAGAKLLADNIARRLSSGKPRHDPIDHFVCGDCPTIPDDFKVPHADWSNR